MRYKFGPYTIDQELFELRDRGQLVRIQPRVLETIIFLIQNRHRVISHEQLLGGPWRGTHVTDDAIRYAIKVARRVLRDDLGAARYIRTVYGRGFRFVGIVAELPDRQPTSSELEAAAEGEHDHNLRA